MYAARNLACALIPVLVVLALAGLKLIRLESVPLPECAWALFVLVFVCSVLALLASRYRATRTVIRTLEWAYLADRVV